MNSLEYRYSIHLRQALLYLIGKENLYDGGMEIKDVIAKWVRTARATAGMSGADLGAKMALLLGSERGHTKANISHWETGKHSPNLRQLLAIAKITGQPLPEEIRQGMAGEPSHLSLVSTPTFDQNAKAAKLGSRAIPVISSIQAGALKEIVAPYAPGDGSSTIYVDEGYSRWVFALEIEGDSMTPDYLPGDIVIIEPAWEPRPGDCVAAKNGKQEATFKKYRLRGTNDQGNDIFELVPINENYPTVRSDEVPLTIIGVLAELRRKTRRR